MSVFLSILFAVILFSLLIFVHELGHFLTAKLFGVQVNEFAMFMGPAIAKWKWGETAYSIRSIPIGGYCAMEGEDEDSDNPRAFTRAKWWKRLIILLAGSVMNFLAGVLIIAVVLFNQPGYVTTELVNVESWCTAGGENGLQVGDRITKIGDKYIFIYEDFALETLFLEDGEYDIVVERQGKKVVLEDVLMKRQAVDDGNGNISMLYGVSFGATKTTAASVPGRILPTANNYVKTVFLSIKMLFTGQAGVQDMTGPVGMVQMMSESASAAGSTGGAFLNMLNFGGLIAINLAVMNLLPIPALDGGRAVCLLLTTAVEKITRKKLDPKYEGYLHMAGMVLLLGLMAIVTLKDIFGLFR